MVRQVEPFKKSMANCGCSPRVAVNACTAGASAAPAYTPSAGFELVTGAAAVDGSGTTANEAATRATTAKMAAHAERSRAVALTRVGRVRRVFTALVTASSFRLGRRPDLERSAA